MGGRERNCLFIGLFVEQDFSSNRERRRMGGKQKGLNYSKNKSKNVHLGHISKVLREGVSFANSLLFGPF